LLAVVEACVVVGVGGRVGEVRVAADEAIKKKRVTVRAGVSEASARVFLVPLEAAPQGDTPSNWLIAEMTHHRSHKSYFPIRS